jgi:hypothetical protein
VISRTSFVSIYLASLATGLTQLLLGWLGHVLWNSTWVSPTIHAQVPWFGYLATYFWWAPYVISVPVMLACSAQGLHEIGSLSRYTRLRKGVLSWACLVGLGVSCALVGHELLRAFTVEPDEWAQWNDLLSQPFTETPSTPVRMALFSLAYFHYFVAYGVCTSFVIGALLLTSTLRVPNSLSDQMASKRGLSDVLLNVRIVVVGWLFYLVLLRSSKVHMWLVYRNEPPALDKIYDFLSSARPYFEASRGGVLTNLMLGLVWIGVCFVTHMFSAQVLSPSIQKQSTTTAGILEKIEAGYRLLGPLWTGLLGLCLLGIVLPPPSGWHFLAVIGVLVGGVLAKRAFGASK